MTMAPIATIDDQFRIGKTYTITQAARLAHVSHGTVRNWLYGSTTSKGYEIEQVFGSKQRVEGEVARVSFLDLAEIVLAARFRSLGIKLQRVREAHDFAHSEWEISHPFAHLNLTSLGGHILAKFEQERPGPTSHGHFVVLSSPAQQVLLPEVVREEIDRFDYAEDKFAERWHPYGKDVPIVVDPRFAGGKPSVAGRGVSVEILHKRWKAGERVASIARDFRLKRLEVEEILQRVA